jgi:hypothetical protein
MKKMMALERMRETPIRKKLAEDKSKALLELGAEEANRINHITFNINKYLISALNDS